MKHVILISLFLIINNCNGQEKEKNNTKNNFSIKKNIKQFILEKYKDWELDNSYTSSTDDRRFLKKGDERVEINFLSDGIQVRLKNVNSPYEKIEGYSNLSKFLIGEGTNFYGLPINNTKQYDEKGQVVKEIDYEKPYKFTIKDLIQKIKSDYKVDLEDTREGGSAGRREKNGIFYYEVNLSSKAESLKVDYILVDGNTGKTVFKTHYYKKAGGRPFDEYLESLKNK